MPSLTVLSLDSEPAGLSRYSHRHIFYAPAVVDGMNGELGFDLEAFTQDGEGLYERLAHGSVAGHDVVEAIAVNPLDHGANKIVSEPVKCSFVLFCIGAIRETIADGQSASPLRMGSQSDLAASAGYVSSPSTIK